MKRAANWPCPFCGRLFVAEKSVQRHIKPGLRSGSPESGDPEIGNRCRWWICSGRKRAAMSNYDPVAAAEQAAIQARMKNEGTTLVLAIFIFGGSRFYLGQIGMGLLMLFTLGLLGVGWIYDMATAKKRCRKHNEEIIAELRRRYQS